MDPRLCRRIWAWFDGSLRQGTGAIGVVVACWGEDDTGLPATAWLEAEMVGAALEDISLLEAQAFSKAAQRVADFHNGGWPGDRHHPDFDLLLPEVLAWLGRRDSR